MAVGITFSEKDEGKKVVDASGDTVGRVIEVRHGTAYVDPDPNIAETIMSKLGWADADEDDYPLQKSTVAEITDDEVRLSQM
ncbi:PRC-barrel domain containing protein [Halobium salinum]|uniref:PRC-barrel domain containing protein n=1 Tax=Halobium salinum TaxID=1364940 RepID=A0ABD5PGF4_9EURY|nr:PRC-barrel domain containing protein [Halobium salinum]